MTDAEFIAAALRAAGAPVDAQPTEPQSEKPDEPETLTPWQLMMQRRDAWREQQRATNEASLRRIDEQRLARLEAAQQQVYRERRMELYRQQAQQAAAQQQQQHVPPMPMPMPSRPVVPVRQAAPPVRHGPGMAARLGQLAAGVTSGSAFRQSKRRRVRS